MTNNGYTKQSGNAVISEDYADLVAYATLFIANSDLVKRFEINAPLAEADKDTYYATGADGSASLGEKEYTDYPFYEE